MSPGPYLQSPGTRCPAPPSSLTHVGSLAPRTAPLSLRVCLGLLEGTCTRPRASPVAVHAASALGRHGYNPGSALLSSKSALAGWAFPREKSLSLCLGGWHTGVPSTENRPAEMEGPRSVTRAQPGDGFSHCGAPLPAPPCSPHPHRSVCLVCKAHHVALPTPTPGAGRA